MPRFMLELPCDAMTRLQACARSQHRTPKEQAEWLLLEALETWASADEPVGGTLGVAPGSAYPAPLPATGSLTNDLPSMFSALTTHLSQSDGGGKDSDRDEGPGPTGP